MDKKESVKRKLIRAAYLSLSAAIICTAFCACNPSSDSENVSSVQSSQFVKDNKIEVNANDTKSEYYAKEISGNYSYTIRKFEKNYDFYTKEGIDIIAYTGGTSDDEYNNCISLYAYDQDVKSTVQNEFESAKLLGYTNVKIVDANSDISLNHERITASDCKGEGVIENALEEIYVFKHGKKSLVVHVNFTTETKDNIYHYLIAMVKTIKLK